MRHTYFFILLYSFFSYSQEPILSSENYFWSFEYQLPQNGIIASKKCWVRSEASANSTVTDSLTIGAPIKVIAQSRLNLKKNNLNLPWLFIEYYNNGVLKNGFIWKGFVALGTATFNQYHFITSLTAKVKQIKKDKDGDHEQIEYVFSLKICDKNFTILSEKNFMNLVGENFTFTNSAIGNWGLQKVECIYRIVFNGEACGVPTEYKYFYWDGKKLEFLIDKFEVGDANAYYHTEELLFPNEKGGKPNTIIKKIIEAENVDEDLEGSTYKIEKTTEYYFWNGTKIQKIKTDKKKPYFKKEE